MSCARYKRVPRIRYRRICRASFRPCDKASAPEAEVNASRDTGRDRLIMMLGTSPATAPKTVFSGRRTAPNVPARVSWIRPSGPRLLTVRGVLRTVARPRMIREGSPRCRTRDPSVVSESADDAAAWIQVVCGLTLADHCDFRPRMPTGSASPTRWRDMAFPRSRLASMRAAASA